MLKAHVIVHVLPILKYMVGSQICGHPLCEKNP